MVTLSLRMPESRISVFTFAEGLFSALAHDLAIEVTEATGSAELTAMNESAGAAHVSIAVAGLRVAGSMKRGNVQPLPAEDVAEIERRLREDVLRESRQVEVDVTLSQKTALLRVSASGGMETTSCGVRIERTGAVVAARGECALSLAALGLRGVRGPLGAFRVKDGIRVRFEAVFG
jgi:hypothetical protein